MTDPPLTADDIPWALPPFSYANPTRPFTGSELVQLAELQDIVDTLDHAQLTAWLLDLMLERQRLQLGLHACMDALHAALDDSQRLLDQYKALREQVMRAAVAEKKGGA